MKKTIDIIGVFSKADVLTIRRDKEYPVLFKMIATVINNDDYQLSNIYLCNGLNSDDCKEYFEAIIELLKINFKDKTQEIDELKYKIQIQSLDKQNEIYGVSDYYTIFSSFISDSKSDILYFNFQSGNIQSKEALMLLYESINKEKLYYFESIKNVSDNKHIQNENIFSFIDKNLNNGFKDYVDDAVNRVSMKSNVDDMVLTFHKDLITNFLSNKLYFQAYSHYDNHKDIFESNNACYLMRQIFDNEFRHLVGKKITIYEVANYFLFRLIYLKAKEESDNLDTKNSYIICERLLAVLHNIESNPSVVQHGSDYDVVKEDVKIEEANGALKYKEIQKIDSNLIKSFNNKCNDLSHPNDEKNTFNITDFSHLLDKLINKFEKEYIRYVATDYKDRSFNKCFIKTINKCIENIKKNLILKKIKFDENNNKKICILSMFGSTDPVKYIENDYKLGSNLSVFKTINNDNNNPSDKKELYYLQKNNNQNKIPYYCILSHEDINFIFSHYDSDTLKKIYGVEKIFYLPFQEPKKDYIDDVNNIILNETTFDPKQLLQGKSLGDSSEGYSYDLCGKYIINVVNSLLDKYDLIYLIESSGLPNCKMAFTFMLLCYPDRIRVINVEGFHNNTSIASIKSVEASVFFDSCGAFNNPSPLKTSFSLLDITKRYDIKRTIGKLFLLQKISYDEFESHRIEVSPEIKKLIEYLNESNNKDYDVNEEIFNICKTLVKINYLISYKMKENALLLLDLCFETILGKILENRLEKQLIDESKIVKEHCHNKDVIERFNNYISDIAKDEKRNKKNKYFRLKSFVRGVNYIMNDINDDKEIYFQALLQLDDTWKVVSDVKHFDPNNDKEIKYDKIIDNLLLFDSTKRKVIKKAYNNLLEKYEEVRKYLNIRFDD